MQLLRVRHPFGRQRPGHAQIDLHELVDREPCVGRGRRRGGRGNGIGAGARLPAPASVRAAERASPGRSRSSPSSQLVGISAAARSSRGHKASPRRIWRIPLVTNAASCSSRSSPARRTGASSRARIVSADAGITGLSSTAATRSASAALHNTSSSSASRPALRHRPRLARGDELVGRVHDPKAWRQPSSSASASMAAGRRRGAARIASADPVAADVARQTSLPVSFGHRRHPVDEVAQVVREIDVVPLVEPLPAEIAVRAERDFLARGTAAGDRDRTRAAASSGSTTCRATCSSSGRLVMNPWPKTCRGSGSPAVISIAGQMTAVEARDVLADDVQIGRPPRSNSAGRRCQARRPRCS